jgi:predicted helicase
MADGYIRSDNKGGESVAPLYLYNPLEENRTPNLNLEIVTDIEKALNLKFTPEKIEDKTTFAPIDILDYIYAVLHSPNYRKKYKEF